MSGLQHGRPDGRAAPPGEAAARGAFGAVRAGRGGSGEGRAGVFDGNLAGVTGGSDADACGERCASGASGAVAPAGRGSAGAPGQGGSLAAAGAVRGGSLASAVRAEALKCRCGAPLKLMVALALPFGLVGGVLMGCLSAAPSFSLWNYYYMLLLPLSVALASACVANADARLKNRSLLSCGVPLGRAWLAKALWCLALSLVGNLTVFACFALGSAGVPGAPGVPAMLGAALACTVTTSWMIPAALFLTDRSGLLAGIFGPLAVQLAGAFAWSVTPAWPLVPPMAAAIVPTAFLPVLPSGEPVGASAALAAAIGHASGQTAVALVVAASAFALLTAAGAVWFRRSEER